MNHPHLKRIVLAAVLAGVALPYASPAWAQRAAAPATSTAPAAAQPAPSPAAAPPAAAPSGEAPAEASPAPPATPATAPPAAAPAPESHIKPMAARPPPPRKFTVPVVVSGIIGAVGLASGVVFTISAASDYSSYKATPNHQVGLAGERATFVADVSYAMAALFGFTALALYLLPDDEEPAKAASTTSPSSQSASNAHRRMPWYAAPLTGTLLRF
jgi:hypothetical protein